jgi:hypothetical protein
MVAGGMEVEVLEVRDGWASVPLQAGGIAIRQELSPAPAVAFLFAEYLDFGDQDATLPVTEFKLGLNTLTNGPLAIEEANRGCQFFLCMNDFTTAAQIKRAHPDAAVMARRFFDHRVVPSVDQIIHGLEGAEHRGVVYIALNEADQLKQDGNDLRQRAELDLAVARRIKEISGATFAAGTFSMGCPDFTNPETCQIIREKYAPAYNSGLIALDMHLYSPNMQHIDQPKEHIWFERRWEFLFTRCGFDPKVRAIYCSECGLDEGGVGGFKAHAANQEYFRDWAAKYIALQSAPLIVDGVSYPSPIVGGAIFQLGDAARWAGYNMAEYLPVLREFYGGRGQRQVRAASKTLMPRPTQPKRKVHTVPG